MTDEDRKMLCEIAVDTKNNSEALGVIFKKIEGNGQPGIMQRLTTVETLHRECQRQRLSEPGRRSNLINWCILVVAVAAMVISAIGVM